MAVEDVDAHSSARERWRPDPDGADQFRVRRAPVHGRDLAGHQWTFWRPARRSSGLGRNPRDARVASATPPAGSRSLTEPASRPTRSSSGRLSPVGRFSARFRRGTSRGADPEAAARSRPGSPGRGTGSGQGHHCRGGPCRPRARSVGVRADARAGRARRLPRRRPRADAHGRQPGASQAVRAGAGDPGDLRSVDAAARGLGNALCDLRARRLARLSQGWSGGPRHPPRSTASPTRSCGPVAARPSPGPGTSRTRSSRCWSTRPRTGRSTPAARGGSSRSLTPSSGRGTGSKACSSATSCSRPGSPARPPASPRAQAAPATTPGRHSRPRTPAGPYDQMGMLTTPWQGSHADSDS